MTQTQRQPVRREDYRPPAFTIDRVELHFDLGEHTRVRSTLHVRRLTQDKEAPLVLHGEHLTLCDIALDDQELTADAYEVGASKLTLANVPDAFTLRTTVSLRPQDNTELQGLYRSGNTFCTQCEAEGFRRITYFIDRPDVLALYSATLVADREHCPVLLCNGNRVEEGSLPDGRHFVRWVDPFPKPSYLFALVAGDLRCRSGSFTTMSGREVALEVWVEPRNYEATQFALEALAEAMRWDERVYGREYDLDIYMIVAVDDFNMGAMENKGLNIFNSAYVLARPTTATDEDYEHIAGVIAHEYFHNWTGNRITCRDWFQLTLKEGLTVFRDSQFTADMTSAEVKRIDDAVLMRTSQFAEDQSPTAHPIRPESYLEMNNFYTMTVYHKGCEVVGMLHTLLGPQGFRRGMDLYFERFDGQAVTCDDFLQAHAEANGRGLQQFSRWYSQLGTPIVHVQTRHDLAQKQYVVTLRQQAPVNVDPAAYQPLHIPFALGLLAADGSPITPRCHDERVFVRGDTAVVELREMEQQVVFEGVEDAPVPSLLRHFSAPVKVRYERTAQELLFLMRHDPDGFSRWDAASSLAGAMLLDLAGKPSDARALEPRFSSAIAHILADTSISGSFKALLLRLPDERMLAQQQEQVDVDGLHEAYWFAMAAIGREHEAALVEIYERSAAVTRGRDDSRDQASIDARRLKNTVLAYLAAAERSAGVQRAQAQLEAFGNMTDVEHALQCLVQLQGAEHASVVDTCLERFYDHYREEPLVIDKWYRAQAKSRRGDTLDRIAALCQRADFVWTNPNRVRALFATFSLRNPKVFHEVSGRGYRLLADAILRLDGINPQTAARLTGAFMPWRRYDEARQGHMQRELERIAGTEGLSNDVYELVSKALGRS